MALRLYGDGSIENVTSINTAVSSTELGYLDGVTSGIQSQTDSIGLVKVLHLDVNSSSNIIRNNVFSSLYRNYKILFQGTGSDAATQTARFRLYSGGVTQNTTAYYSSRVYWANATNPTLNTNWGINNWAAMSLIGTKCFSTSIDLFNPYDSSKFTTFNSISNAQANTNNQFTINQGQHEVSVSADGFQFEISAGTVTGTIDVYGYAGV